MGESLIRQITFAEAEIEVSRDELREFAKKGDYEEVGRVAARLADELAALATLREKASALAGRDLAKSVFRQLKAMANAHRPSARAIAAEPQTEDANEERESNHGWNN